MHGSELVCIAGVYGTTHGRLSHPIYHRHDTRRLSACALYVPVFEAQ